MIEGALASAYSLKGNHKIVKTPPEKLDDTPRVKHPRLRSLIELCESSLSLAHTDQHTPLTHLLIVETGIYMKQKSSLILHRSQHMSFLLKVYSLPPFPDLTVNIGEGGCHDSHCSLHPQILQIFFCLPWPFHTLPFLKNERQRS